MERRRERELVVEGSPGIERDVRKVVRLACWRPSGLKHIMSLNTILPGIVTIRQQSRCEDPLATAEMIVLDVTKLIFSDSRGLRVPSRQGNKRIQVIKAVWLCLIV